MLHMNFGGNPIIQELLENNQTDIDKLLEIDSFPVQFRNNNPKLEKYMNINKYQQLVEYVTVLGSGQNKKKSYKYPLVAAEILSADSTMIRQVLLTQKPVTVETIQVEQKWVEKQVDECDSEYCSSNGSNNRLDFQDMLDDGQEKEQQNISPNIKTENKRVSIDSKVSESKQNSSSGSHRQSSASITSDDFPMAENGKKIIKVKQTISRKVVKQHKPFLQQLFNYFNSEINHTLAGYICKILESLLKKKPINIMQYIFRSKIHKNMLRHIQSYSVCEFFSSLILNTETEYEKLRQQLLFSLIKQSFTLNDHELVFKAANYIHTVNEVMTKLDPINQVWHYRLIESLYEEEMLLSITQACFKEINNHSSKQSSLQLIFIFLKKMSLAPAPGSNNNENMAEKSDQKSQKTAQLKKLLKNKTQICFKDFISKAWDLFQSFSNSQTNIPSSIVIKSLEIINYLLYDDLYWSRIQLSNEESAFRILCNLCRKVPKNNILHNQVFQVLKLVLHKAEQEPKLASNLFEEKQVFTFLIEAIHKKQILYRGQSILFCHMIKNSHSAVLHQMKSKPGCKWAKVEEALNSEIEKTNKTLAGFSIKKNLKPYVTFEKQSICEHFKHFLKGQIPQKINESEQSQDEVQDLSSSRGSMQWNDWNDFNNYTTDEIDQ